MSKHKDDRKEVEIPCLIGLTGEFSGQTIELLEKLKLGRHPENDLCFKDQTVSGFHAQIDISDFQAELTKKGECFEIKDTASKNRTKVNGRKIFKPMVLSNNDLIQIGKNTFRFCTPKCNISETSVTIPIRDRVSSEILKASNNNSVHTQKINTRRHRPFKKNNKEANNHNVKIAKANSGSLKEILKTTKTRKVVVNTISVCMVLLILTIILMSLNSKNKSKVHRDNNQDLWEYQNRLQFILDIWTQHEKQILEGNNGRHADENKAKELLKEAQNIFFRMQKEEPGNAWTAYMHCLRSELYSDNPDTNKFCDVLIDGIKARIEEEEDIHFRNFNKEYKLKEWDNSLNELYYIQKLLDLNNDNKDTKLSKWYYSLEQRVINERSKSGK